MVIGLLPATIAMTATKPNEIGSYMGMAFGVLSILGLTGTPNTGAMIRIDGSYEPAIIFAGVVTWFRAAVNFGGRISFAGAKTIA